MMSNKNIYLIIGESGAGKSAIVDMLEHKYSYTSVQSYTTRPKRNENETGHIFITDDEFSKLKNMVAYTEFDGYKYCATAEQVEKSDLYIIDPDGVNYFKEKYKGKKKIKVIYISATLTTRYERMRNRSENNGMPYLKAVDNALSRIKNDIVTFSDVTKMADIVIKNDNIKLSEAVRIVNSYIKECEQK